MRELVLILHNIRSLHNVGSIFRTADAAGVKKIYICGITPRPTDRLGNIRPQLGKVALGAERTVLWETEKSALRAVRALQKDGFRVYAVEQSRQSVPYYSLKIKKDARIALLLGNEVRGIPPSLLAAADKILEIPMAGKKESLNVAVSAGIVLFGVRYLMQN